MSADYAALTSDDRIVGEFLQNYYKIWDSSFPNLNRRAHWHAIFALSCSINQAISLKSIHRVLYGGYGMDIRTCIERLRECEHEGVITLEEMAGEGKLSANSLVAATDKLHDSFTRHCQDAVREICCAFGGAETMPQLTNGGGERAMHAIHTFFMAYDEKWREACDVVLKEKGLTFAHVDAASKHLVTHSYWAIVMFLWARAAYEADCANPPAMIVDEINSKMWDTLRLGHLAIKERVDNLIRWGFFIERSIKKHKAVSLTPVACAAMRRSLTETKPLLRALHDKLFVTELVASAG
jgi:hypothetical protein